MIKASLTQGLLFAWMVTTPLHASPAPNFDKVVFEDELENQMVPLGFGGLALLNVIEAEEVRTHYEILRTLGKVQVYVQKLPPKNKRESMTTRYTFEAWQQTGFTTGRKTASFTVDSYHIVGTYDGATTHYRVTPVKRSPRS